MRRSPLRRSATPMKRTPMRRARQPLGARARERRRLGGPRAAGRASLSPEGFHALRAMIAGGRAGGRCEATGVPCVQTGELEHAIPSSQGGADSWGNCYWISRAAHKAKHGAFASGKLLVTPLWDGRFNFQFVVAASKAAYLRGEYHLGWSRSGGRAATPEERMVLERLA